MLSYEPAVVEMRPQKIIPIFYIVMRRNNHLERSHSADRKSCGRIIEQITMPSEMLCHDKKKENGDQFHKHGTYI
uniref:Uncharacterized protein n=1 Tax=Wuchereria bancrofti TaxID=6293 RepID=A0AAF5PGX7_WUCBA